MEGRWSVVWCSDFFKMRCTYYIVEVVCCGRVFGEGGVVERWRIGVGSVVVLFDSVWKIIGSFGLRWYFLWVFWMNFLKF